MSYVNSALWVNADDWLVSILDIPHQHTLSKKPGYTRIVIEGLLQENRFLVEYRVRSDEKAHFVQRISRVSLDHYRLSYGNRYAVSYYATLEWCKVFASRLDALSQSISLHNQSNDIKMTLDDFFKIKTSLFSWCLDQIEKTQATTKSNGKMSVIGFD